MGSAPDFVVAHPDAQGQNAHTANRIRDHPFLIIQILCQPPAKPHLSDVWSLYFQGC